ncbi:MAG: hypothetical protein A2275_02670 [Bacteroidetes bacterium RIFOXYA12_FULL_35_11]|nr:MAG: hypothetical protein A2X01_07080 [Bacteroidetes bacterium GWF2_35_48]OFY82104.1 MAG: hypothetical protein A2275_02670 [Bacteroidetes bacterium RIFOXYA12_FULL_35_11]OFY93302.1 MAG: hypothetical protein A2491_15475 [Bacteroidetes bacterium RIFOXYC12_FULL_35_7]HBX53149.1 hypothetical protein [Bacteroidales bacterium]
MKNLFFYFSMFFLSTNFLFAETNPADTCKSKNQNAIASENLCLEEENFFTGTTEFKAKQDFLCEGVGLQIMPDLANDPDACLKGRQDAEMFHGKKGAHFALGLFTGIFGIIGAAVASPSPYSGKNTVLMSKNKEFFGDPAYMTCYKKKAKGQNVGATCGGFAVWLILLLLL